MACLATKRRSICSRDHPSQVVPLLARHGARVIRPYLRGFGPTRFLSDSTLRSGQQAALGSDLSALLEALRLEGAIVAGWICQPTKAFHMLFNRHAGGVSCFITQLAHACTALIFIKALRAWLLLEQQRCRGWCRALQAMIGAGWHPAWWLPFGRRA